MSAVMPDAMVAHRVQEMGEAQNAAEALFRAAEEAVRFATSARRGQ
jgi:hypothetical protein